MFAAFYFDCDSTLSTLEGVDELTRRLSASERDELLALTRQAMDGTLELAKVYEERLGLLAPSAEELAAVGRFYIENLVTDAAATIAALHHMDKHVGIISGGLRQPVGVLARHLGIADDNVHAVPVIFDAAGAYVGFDHDSPLWRNGGKAEVIDALPTAHRPVLFMGDGVTDLEAQGHADLFVGFGGVERRAAVEATAEVYVTRPSLAAVLDVGLTDTEKRALATQPEFAELLTHSEN